MELAVGRRPSLGAKDRVACYVEGWSRRVALRRRLNVGLAVCSPGVCRCDKAGHSKDRRDCGSAQTRCASWLVGRKMVKASDKAKERWCMQVVAGQRLPETTCLAILGDTPTQNASCRTCSARSLCPLSSSCRPTSTRVCRRATRRSPGRVG